MRCKCYGCTTMRHKCKKEIVMDYWHKYNKTVKCAEEHDEQERKINREYNNETRPHN